MGEIPTWFMGSMFPDPDVGTMQDRNACNRFRNTDSTDVVRIFALALQPVQGAQAGLGLAEPDWHLPSSSAAFPPWKCADGGPDAVHPDVSHPQSCPHGGQLPVSAA